MLLVNSNRLRAGMTAARNTERPDHNGVDLLCAGAKLTGQAISQLKKLSIDRCMISHPELDKIDIATTSEELADSYKNLRNLLRLYYTPGTKFISVEDYSRLCGGARRLIMPMVAQREKNRPIDTELLSSQEHPAEVHAANVAYLSLATALKVESFMVEERRSAGALAACDITNLAVGAAMHDIGKTQIPSTLRLHEPIGGQPSRSYLNHVIRGGQMISPRVSPTARSVVMHHHQRYDGSGFPDMAIVTNKRRTGALAEKKIHIFSRIVMICDHFDNLLHSGLSENSRIVSPCQAMYKLLKDELSARFDPYLLWAFATMIAPWPLASHIKLNDKVNAVVVAHKTQNPCRPTVMIVDDAFKPIKQVDLAAESSLQVTHWLDMPAGEYLYKLPPKPTDDSVIKEAAEAMLAHQ